MVRTPIDVPASGLVDAPFVPPTVATANPRYRATLLVMTPAGHAQLASLDVRILTEPPPIELRVVTPFGSSAVEISGRAVEIDDTGLFAVSVGLPPWPTEVTVEVSDQLGNMARHTVSGIGLFDYRGLPWVPITVALVALAGVFLLFRVPRSSPLPRPSDDDAALEELEPD